MRIVEIRKIGWF